MIYRCTWFLGSCHVKMAAASGLVILAVLTCCLRQGWTAAPCPCTDPSLCEPIKGAPKNEIFGFVTSEDNWPKYNWSLLTTVALFTKFNSSLLCHAHSKGVRVVLSATYPTNELENTDKVKVSGYYTCVYWINIRSMFIVRIYTVTYSLEYPDPHTRKGGSGR